MKKRHRNTGLATLVLSLAFASLSTIATGQSPPQRLALPEAGLTIQFIGDTSYVARLGNLERELPQRRTVRLRFRTFDPLVENPSVRLPAPLRLSPADLQSSQSYIVQFYTQAFDAYQEKIVALGGRVYLPLPDHALLVQLAPATLAQVQDLPFVRWVGPYQPAFKLEEGLDTVIANAEVIAERYSILLVGRDELQRREVAGFIRGIGGRVDLVSQSSRLEATLDSFQLRLLAQHEDVLFIDRWSPLEDDMDIVREISGAVQLEAVAGYTGQGVRGEVMDDGIRASHQDFQLNPPIFHPSNNNNNFDHGNKVFSIVFGSRNNNPQAGGLLPDAEQPIVAASAFVGDLFTHVGELVDPNGIFRAVFQTRSIGNARTIQYTTISAEFDRISFEHDFLITQSQSNAGNRDSRPQAWAKNILSVGGVRHNNTLTRSDDVWNNSASIGPAADGRIKPDLWHFFDGIRAANHTSDTGYTNFGGTSGATPIVAGYAGLVFQMWADGVFAGGPGLGRDVFNSRPHPTTVKALLIHSAFQYPFSGTNHDKTRVHQGWGMPDVAALHTLAQDNGFSLPILIDETEVLSPLEVDTFFLTATGNEPLKVTLVYADPPGSPSASVHRINDLTLRVTDPNGTVFFGNNGLLVGTASTPGGSPNTVDTVENVFVNNPAPGQWRIEILGDEIVQDSHRETSALDADYALVASGGGTSQPPTGSCLFSANFNSGADGFTFVDDPQDPAFTSGSAAGGALNVNVGGIDGTTVTNMLGSWNRTCTLPNTTNVTITLAANLTQAADYEADEVSEVRLSVNGNTSVLASLTGDGNGGGDQTTGVQTFTVNASLPSGSSTISLGCFNNKKTFNNEDTDCAFDSIAIAADGGQPQCSVEQNFDINANGWSNAAGSTCTSGAFIRGTPTEVVAGGVTTQVGGDHTSGTGSALFTAVNTAAGTDDVDGGNCILLSPVFNVGEASTLSAWFFHGQRDAGDDAAGDFFRLEMSTNGGGSFTPLATNGDTASNAVWTEATSAIPAGAQVQLRMQASDGAAGGDLIEAGIDDVSICPN